MDGMYGTQREPENAAAYGYHRLQETPVISLTRMGAPGITCRETRSAIDWYSVGTTLCLIAIMTVLFAEIFRFV